MYKQYDNKVTHDEKII